MARFLAAQREARVAALALMTLGAVRSSLGFLSPATAASKGAAASVAGAALRGARAALEGALPAPAPLAAGAPDSVAGAVLAALAGAVVATVARRATRTEWYRKVKRVGGDQAVFDVEIPKPMGIKLMKFPQRAGVGVMEIVPGSNTDELNRRVCIDEEPGMWVLEGDRIMAVNDINTEEADVEGVVKIVAGDPDRQAVKLTLMRNTRKGPIRVIMMPEGRQATVRRNARLSQAAEYAAGKELKYGCIDGWCGVCWHRERATNGVFKPCCDVLTGDWDNVMPMVLNPKPERAGDSTFLKPRGV